MDTVNFICMLSYLMHYLDFLRQEASQKFLRIELLEDNQTLILFVLRTFFIYPPIKELIVVLSFD